MTETDIQTAAAFWDKRAKTPLPSRVRWWQSPTILRHLNKIACGEAISGAHEGFHRLLRDVATDGVYRKAVSVGCGVGHKEASLVRSGLVQTFLLFEISSERIRQGREMARQYGIEDRMRYVEGDALQLCSETDFDLVYWCNALHHMPDTLDAVEWSRDRLGPNGIFGMDDFVGPSRFQWSDLSLTYASKFRQCLQGRHLNHPTVPGRVLPTKISRPTVAGMIAADPSEAADSDRIIASIRSTFDDARIIPTGGVIYHLGLNDVLANIDETAEASLLKTALRNGSLTTYTWSLMQDLMKIRQSVEVL